MERSRLLISLLNSLIFSVFKLRGLLKFILNDRVIETSEATGITLLDFIRYQQQLTGTKIGCREGDCGACSILVGSLENNNVTYRSATSCLMPLANAAGKHIVTIEGINGKKLTPVQEAFASEGATQCGFCTPGFIVSLTGYCLSTPAHRPNSAIESVNGNICRCTGYKSIERAAEHIEFLLAQRKDTDALQYAMAHDVVPAYFASIPERLAHLVQPPSAATGKMVGGGTDLYVQQHDVMPHTAIRPLSQEVALKYIREENGYCLIGAGATVTDLAESPIIQRILPNLGQPIKLVSSTPIRNMATLAGNLVNASPIGDFSIMLLALDARIKLESPSGSRMVPLRHFYKGYKQLDKVPDEVVTEISFPISSLQRVFQFDKVCKRTYLDIASVNVAINLELNNGIIESAGLAAGGVAPVPAFLSNASGWLTGQPVS
ncbi:MAG TPA: FAD binding domain-containing protein, partial [Ferruginibacter sp.]|nr:FAD binding domain-containing protein [Ferruginibacter sp.]